MKRTPALVAAAAAFGLLSALGLEARADALTREVSPHMVSVAWLTPGDPSPAGFELDGPGGRVTPADRRMAPPDKKERITRLPPMRARVSEEVVAARREQLRIHRKEFVHSGGCPREQAREAMANVIELHRS